MTWIITPAGGSSYAYNSLGGLTDVTQSGKQIHYIYDGQNRLVGKKVNGTLTEWFLYDGQLQVIAKTDATGQIVEQFVYGTRPNVPDYIITAGQVYRVISNQLGSPVLIVNASTGAIAEQVSYDAWGNITSDTNPLLASFVGPVVNRASI
jgi:YD repeat-containing protein